MNSINEYTVPQLFTGENQEINSADIFTYESNTSTIKNRVMLTTHLFSFLTDGTKEIVTGNASTKIDKTEFVLITAGKCFMSEKISGAGTYSTTLLFFDNNLLQNFFEEQENKIQGIIKKNKLVYKDILVFSYDDFTRAYVNSLKFLGKKSKELIMLKLREILLYLLETRPLEFCSFFAESPGTSEEIKFRNTISAHIDSNLSVNELAYLCNVSLSTFKRKFTSIFNDSPTSWIRKKRMEHAAFLLKYNKERVSDIYQRFGYENLSSFSQSFKEVFGVSPKEYQLQH